MKKNERLFNQIMQSHQIDLSCQQYIAIDVLKSGKTVYYDDSGYVTYCATVNNLFNYDIWICFTGDDCWKRMYYGSFDESYVDFTINQLNSAFYKFLLDCGYIDAFRIGTLV